MKEEIIDGISFNEICQLYPSSTLTKYDYDNMSERFRIKEESWRNGNYKEQLLFRLEKRKADLYNKQ